MQRTTVLAGAALAALTLAGCAHHQHGGKKADAAAAGPKGECHGVNECKGKGVCAGPGYECAGHNACKGKGWLSLTKAECVAKGGSFKG